MPAFAMPSRAFLTVVAFTLAFVLASASPLRRIPALEQTAVRPRGRAASSICTSSAECMNTPPANANRYCDSGVCSWRCRLGYSSTGSSCVLTSTDSSTINSVVAASKTAVLAAAPASQSCTATSDCTNTIPANSNRYCNKGVCSYRCKTGYIASGSSCVKTASSTNLSSSTKRTSSATSAVKTSTSSSRVSTIGSTVPSTTSSTTQSPAGTSKLSTSISAVASAPTPASCSASSDCSAQARPVNSNAYCASGKCTFRCRTGYALTADGASCVSTSTATATLVVWTTSVTTTASSTASLASSAVETTTVFSSSVLSSSIVSTTPALSSTVSASVYTWNPTPTRTYSTAPTPPAATPVLIRRYRSGDFFDTEQFSYFNLTDPTDGLVTYLTAPDALTQGLATLNPDGTARLGADRTSTLAAGQNRSSVRISSIAAYDPGTLLLFDLAHVPVGCGVWPALWMYSDPWPTMGEIDILEGVNERTYNQLTIHTLSGCNRNKSIPMTGSWVYSKDSCDTATGSSCSVQDNDPTSFGEGFNQAGGGVFAVQMAETGISIWHWPRSKIPSDVAAGEPRPQTWGYPVAAWDGSTCDTRTYFSQLWITLNIDVCGRMAAKSATWKSSTASGPTCAAKYATCADAAADPAAFKEAYFDVNYIKVFSV